MVIVTDPTINFEERGDKLHSSWQARAIQRTRSHTTTGGMILIAAIGRRPSNPPFLSQNAVIEADGYVYADGFVTPEGHVYAHQPLGTVEQITDFFRRLADDLKLSDSERAELFGELKKWIRLDHRSNKEKGL